MAYIVSSPYSPVYTTETYVSIDTFPIKTESVYVSTLPSTNYYLPTNLYYDTTPLIYTNPIMSSISYTDVNADKDLQKKVTKKFFSQLYNKWVPELYPRLLDYVKLTEKDITLVKSKGEAQNNKTKEDEIAEKINYLAEYIMTKKDIYEELYYYAERKRLNWWDLSYYSDDVELLLVKKLEERIKDMILE
jgi:hypothetical protein